MFCLLIFTVALAIASGNLRSAQLRSIGGYNTTISKHPYQLSLQIDNRHKCGASLIEPNVALTSINCTRGVPLSQITLVAGSSSVKDDENLNIQVAGVDDICTHPKYILANGDYDVAVIKLNLTFELNDVVQTIKLQSEDIQVPNGVVATITGWGTLAHIDNIEEILQEVTVTKIPLNDCRIMYAPYFGSYVTSRMACYGYREGQPNICAGDIGGPLVVNGKLVGIVSKIIFCDTPNTPGVFTRLEVPTIRNQIDNCLSHFNQE